MELNVFPVVVGEIDLNLEAGSVRPATAWPDNPRFSYQALLLGIERTDEKPTLQSLGRANSLLIDLLARCCFLLLYLPQISQSKRFASYTPMTTLYLFD